VIPGFSNESRDSYFSLNLRRRGVVQRYLKRKRWPVTRLTAMSSTNASNPPLHPDVGPVDALKPKVFEVAYDDPGEQ